MRADWWRRYGLNTETRWDRQSRRLERAAHGSKDHLGQVDGPFGSVLEFPRGPAALSKRTGVYRCVELRYTGSRQARKTSPQVAGSGLLKAVRGVRGL